MNLDIKAAWISALRSKQYAQGRKLLRKDNKFCCLGVLCNLHAQAHPDIAKKQKSAYGYMGAGSMPGLAVVNWAGLSYQEAGKLAELNDGGKSFKEIANYIEKHL